MIPRWFSRFCAAALCLGSIAAASPLQAGQGDGLGNFVGRWQIDPARTHMGRNGPGGDNILRSQSFTFVFVRAGQRLRMDVYAQYPQASPSRSMIVNADGRTHPCEGPASCMTVGGNAAEQSFSFQLIDDHLLTRLFYIKGAAYDYSTMALSPDGQTLTLLSWAPETPGYQNIQVFVRQP